MAPKRKSPPLPRTDFELGGEGGGVPVTFPISPKRILEKQYPGQPQKSDPDKNATGDTQRKYPKSPQSKCGRTDLRFLRRKLTFALSEQLDGHQLHQLLVVAEFAHDLLFPRRTMRPLLGRTGSRRYLLLGYTEWNNSPVLRLLLRRVDEPRRPELKPPATPTALGLVTLAALAAADVTISVQRLAAALAAKLKPPATPTGRSRSTSQ